MALQKFPKISLLSLAASLVLFAVAACGGQAVDHSFQFYKNPGVEVLDWRYGDSKLQFTHAPKAWLAMGHIPQGTSVSATFPPGDSLYVKWRIEATGAVYEDTVDLRNRLPSDMNQKRVYFAIKGSQLYVYVISKKEFHDEAHSDCPVAYYHERKCMTVYPDQQQNF